MAVRFPNSRDKKKAGNMSRGKGPGRSPSGPKGAGPVSSPKPKSKPDMSGRHYDDVYMAPTKKKSGPGRSPSGPAKAAKKTTSSSTKAPVGRPYPSGPGRSPTGPALSKGTIGPTGGVGPVKKKREVRTFTAGDRGR